MRVTRGFTLIELMIVVAIIGILAAIAVPAHQDYVTRARISEGLGMANAAKSSISEYRQVSPAWPSSNQEAGLAPTISSQYVSDLSISANGVVTITYATASGAPNGATIIMQPTLQPSGVVTWTCSGGTLSDQYRPSQCR